MGSHPFEDLMIFLPQNIGWPRVVRPRFAWLCDQPAVWLENTAANSLRLNAHLVPRVNSSRPRRTRGIVCSIRALSHQFASKSGVVKQQQRPRSLVVVRPQLIGPT